MQGSCWCTKLASPIPSSWPSPHGCPRAPQTLNIQPQHPPPTQAWSAPGLAPAFDPDLEVALLLTLSRPLDPPSSRSTVLPRPHRMQSPSSAPEAAESPALSAPPRVPPAPQLALSRHPLRPFPTHLGGLCLIVLTPPAGPSGTASGSRMADQVYEVTGEMTPHTTLQNSNKCRRSTYSSSSGAAEYLLALSQVRKSPGVLRCSRHTSGQCTPSSDGLETRREGD